LVLVVQLTSLSITASLQQMRHLGSNKLSKRMGEESINRIFRESLT
jgi:hypothetical protein